jgi:hypothetical protein
MVPIIAAQKALTPSLDAGRLSAAAKSAAIDLTQEPVPAVWSLF